MLRLVEVAMLEALVQVDSSGLQASPGACQQARRFCCIPQFPSALSRRNRRDARHPPAAAMSRSLLQRR
jgi:hypothetical protein